MLSSFRTEGIALVTGAARGIGRAAAEALAESGATVIVFADVDVPGAQKAAVACMQKAYNSKMRTLATYLDVRDEESVMKVVDEVVEKFGRIDYLVNCAGIDVDRYRVMPDNDMYDYDKVMATNATGILLMSRHVIRYMRKQEERAYISRSGAQPRSIGRGCIVNVLASLSFGAVPGKVAYIAAAHAGMGITKATAQDVTGRGIRANAICPSWVKTEMWEQEKKKFPPVEEIVKSSTPLGRPAEPEEIGEAVVYLCSPASSYINGIGLLMDAGFTMQNHLGT